MIGRLLTRIATIVSAIGAINWGLIAFTPGQFDLVAYVAMLAGGSLLVAQVMYGIVALSGVLVLLSTFGARCSVCD